MKKKILWLAGLLPACMGLSGAAVAAGAHGQYEGSPIVTVVSGGHPLQTEDVPAILYNNRTMVPLYMLKELGADVAWDGSAYRVDISLNTPTGSTPTQPASPPSQPAQSSNQEERMLQDAYEWLSDTDNAMLMYAERLQQYCAMDNPSAYAPIVDQEYQTLQKQQLDSMNMAFKVYDKVKMENNLHEIVSSEQQTMDQLNQTMGLAKVWMDNSGNTQMKASLKLSLLASFKSAQDNVNHTKGIIHQLLLQEMNLNLSSASE